MKIGILTLFHGNNNWGGVLQGYALKTAIEENFPGVSVDILKYHGRNIVYSNKVRQAMQYSPKDIAHKLQKRLDRKGKALCASLLENRSDLFRGFTDEYTTNTTAYNDETIIEAAKKYDCLISGSDQVWNPNVGMAGFFQAAVKDECRKVAYAASIARDDLSKHERNTMIPLIENFDGVSVREATAKRILEKYSDKGVQVKEVLDPVMLLPKEAWKELAEKSSMSFTGEYAVAFFFSESKSYKDEINACCKKKGLMLKSIPFARGEYLASDQLGEDEKIYDLGPYEFLKLLAGAKCVFTDSFHGAVFSTLFQKPFCVFERDKKSKVSKNSRLYDFLNKFDLTERLLRDERIDVIMDKEIDFAKVESLLKNYKEESLCFLRQQIEKTCEKPEKIYRDVSDLDQNDCCGCGLCVTQCPIKCIEMKRNAEGFAYPVVSQEKCVGCGKCLTACRSKNAKIQKTQDTTYVGYHENEDIRMKSSSGGLFYALASVILGDGGCVYGAALLENCEVSHIRVEQKADLQKLMGSKYVQSRMENLYEQVAQDLKNGRQVLFSGTPCQVAAVRNFTEKLPQRENLLLVDMICHGVPSPGVWQSYLKYRGNRLRAEINYVSFRDKSIGWHDYAVLLKTRQGSRTESHEKDAYMRSFLSDKNIRASCYCCAHKGDNYRADITMGDAWKIEKTNPAWVDDKGVSLFVVRTKRGEEILQRITDFCFEQADGKLWAKYNPSLVEATEKPFGRDSFFADFSSLDPMMFWKKQSKMPVKKRLRYTAKRFVKAMGLEKVLRKNLG